jgi:hypothetical protein
MLGALTGGALSGLLGSVGIGTILGKLSTWGLLKLLPIIGIGAILGGLAGGELGELLGNESLGKVLGALTGGALAVLLGKVGIGTILTKLGLGVLAKKLGSLGIGTLVNPLTGSLVLLLGGIISLSDLVDGDISSWNLPAKFGFALGEGFRRAWPDMAEKIHNAFTNNPVAEAGETTGKLLRGETSIMDIFKGAGEFSLDALSDLPVSLDSLFGGQAVGNFLDGTPFGQAGARIQSGGIMRVHEGEELVPADITRDLSMVDNLTSMGDGGGGSTNNVTQVDNITVELSGEFDPSDVTRRDLDSLADRLVDLIGDKTNRRAGVR